MKTQVLFVARILVWIVLAAGEWAAVKCAAAVPVVLYQTGFETNEGFRASAPLVGQNGWVGFGNGGNGFVDDFFPGGGQQAFLGFFPPTGTNDQLTVWRPINFTPTNRNQQLVTFTVQMSITDSSAGNTNYDDFRWSFYNATAQRLFTLDFENLTFRISYALDDTNGFIFTGATFTNAVSYSLLVQLDFAHNLWHAWLDDRLLASNLPITTQNAPLTLGDADAVWVIRTPGAAGNNYLLFDNYYLSAEPAPVLPPALAGLNRLANGEVRFRIFGERDFRYIIDSSTNLVNWSARQTNSAATGVFDFQDAGAATNSTRGFYRVRQLP